MMRNLGEITVCLLLFAALPLAAQAPPKDVRSLDLAIQVDGMAVLEKADRVLVSEAMIGSGISILNDGPFIDPSALDDEEKKPPSRLELIRLSDLSSVRRAQIPFRAHSPVAANGHFVVVEQQGAGNMYLLHAETLAPVVKKVLPKPAIGVSALTKNTILLMFEGERSRTYSVLAVPSLEPVASKMAFNKRITRVQEGVMLGRSTVLDHDLKPIALGRVPGTELPSLTWSGDSGRQVWASPPNRQAHRHFTKTVASHLSRPLIGVVKEFRFHYPGTSSNIIKEITEADEQMRCEFAVEDMSGKEVLARTVEFPKRKGSGGGKPRIALSGPYAVVAYGQKIVRIDLPKEGPLPLHVQRFACPLVLPAKGTHRVNAPFAGGTPPYTLHESEDRDEDLPWNACRLDGGDLVINLDLLTKHSIAMIEDQYLRNLKAGEPDLEEERREMQEEIQEGVTLFEETYGAEITGFPMSVHLPYNIKDQTGQILPFYYNIVLDIPEDQAELAYTNAKKKAAAWERARKQLAAMDDAQLEAFLDKLKKRRDALIVQLHEFPEYQERMRR